MLIEKLFPREAGLLTFMINFRWDQKFIIFVDRIVPSWMSITVGSGGMVATYVAVMLVVGRFVREIV